MHSFGILVAILIACVALTNALQCRPLTCMIHCPDGFERDAQGCAVCTCRRPAVNLLQTANGMAPSNTTTTTRHTTTTTKKTSTTTKKTSTTTKKHILRSLNETPSTSTTARSWLRRLLS